MVTKGEKRWFFFKFFPRVPPFGFFFHFVVPKRKQINWPKCNSEQTWYIYTPALEAEVPTKWSWKSCWSRDLGPCQCQSGLYSGRLQVNNPKTFLRCSIQSYEIKSPPWTILSFRILGIFSVENISCVFLCFKLETIVSYWEEYCESVQSWLLEQLLNMNARNLFICSTEWESSI